TGGAVAARARSHLPIGNATAVNALTQSHELLVLGEARSGFLAGYPEGNVAHVIIGHRTREALHDGVVALARFVLLQLLDQVLWVLLRKLGVGRGGGIAVSGVAC